MVASLISKTCQKEQQRVIAAQAGILEALAETATPAILETLRCPSHARARSSLVPTLHAIKSVLIDSKSRGIQFLNAPALTLAFSKLDPANISYDEKSTWDSGNQKASHVYRSSTTPVDSLLGQVPGAHIRNVPTAHNGYHPLDRGGIFDRHNQASRSPSTAIEISQSQGLEYVGETENPLIPILAHIFRSFDDTTSLMAAGLLVTLNRIGLTKRPKEHVFALLLVPSLVRMLDKDLRSTQSHNKSVPKSSAMIVKEEASEILATLTNGCLETQVAAYDAGAIKKLSQLLKESFDPLPGSPSVPAWQSESTISNYRIKEDASRLGPTGISPATRHMFRLRECCLTALAAIGSEKDEYRKAVIENGVVPFVIKCLAAEPLNIPSSSNDEHTDESSNARSDSTWNHRDVVLAACGAARALSRSVSTLRTSLMDAGLPAPLFALLKSHDIGFQIAATGVLCNLVLKFSPMRDVSLAEEFNYGPM